MGRPKGSKNKKTITENPAPEKSVTESPATEGEIVSPPATNTNDNQESALATVPDDDVIHTVAVIGGVPTELLKKGLETQTEQRALVKQFVQHHLEDGTDYGRIHVMSKDKCPDQYNCKKDYHFSKPVLFKPGQEKLFSLFQITSELEKDQDAYDMLPDTKNLVAYKCVMYRDGPSGRVKVGEGRGAATVGDKGRDVNATIKIAQKRARMDACLSLGFSEYFAQDLDDPDYKSAAEMANQRVAAEAEARDKDEFGLFPRDPQLPIDDKERVLLFKSILDYGIQQYHVIDSLKLNGIENPGAMKSGEARMLLAAIKNNAYKKPEQPEIPNEPTIIPASQLPEDNYPMTPPRVQEAELVVDDDLKEHVQEKYAEIGFNARGKMWFMKFVAGKPYGSFEKFTDDEWRRAYQHIEDINDLKVDIDTDYLDAGAAPAAPKSDADKVAEMFPGSEVITTADGSKVIKSTGEVVEDDNPIPDDLR